MIKQHATPASSTIGSFPRLFDTPFLSSEKGLAVTVFEKPLLIKYCKIIVPILAIVMPLIRRQRLFRADVRLRQFLLQPL